MGRKRRNHSTDSESDIAKPKTPGRKKAICSDSEEDKENDHMFLDEDPRTPVQHPSATEEERGARSSARLHARPQRVFSLPSRRSVFDKIDDVQERLSLSEYRPRKLVNDYTKQSSRYNYDPAYTSGESEGMDDFIEDDFDYVDESSYVSEDSNVSSDPDRAKFKGEGKEKSQPKRKRKTSSKQTPSKSKTAAKKNQKPTENKATHDQITPKSSKSAARRRRRSSRPVITESSDSDEEVTIQTSQLSRSVRKQHRTIQSDTSDSEDNVPLSQLREPLKPLTLPKPRVVYIEWPLPSDTESDAECLAAMLDWEVDNPSETQGFAEQAACGNSDMTISVENKDLGHDGAVPSTSTALLEDQLSVSEVAKDPAVEVIEINSSQTSCASVETMLYSEHSHSSESDPSPSKKTRKLSQRIHDSDLEEDKVNGTISHSDDAHGGGANGTLSDSDTQEGGVNGTLSDSSSEKVGSQTQSQDSELGEMSKSILEGVSQRSRTMAGRRNAQRHSFDQLRRQRKQRKAKT